VQLREPGDTRHIKAAVLEVYIPSQILNASISRQNLERAKQEVSCKAQLSLVP
jgi:hypothetical protein